MKQYLIFRGFFCKKAIEVPKTKYIPIDYYGCIGVPITALDKIDTNTWELLDCIRPKIKGKALFRRIIMRKKLPTEIEEYINKGGVVFQTDEDLLIPLRQEGEDC